MQQRTSVPGEQWRPIPGHEGTYEVSNFGRVYSVPRRKTTGGLLAQKLSKRGGYPSVGLVTRGVQSTHEVHRLVAAAFLGPRPSSADVCHADGNPLNCTAENLSYGSRSDNINDMIRHGTHPTASRTHCPQGHPYDGANTLVIPSRPRARYCRTCNIARKSARRSA